VRYALLIGVSEFGPGLEALPATKHDVERLAQILGSNEHGNFDVSTLVNPSRQTFDLGVFDFFRRLNKEDVGLLYFSGHGVKDDNGRLYFASSDTRNDHDGSLVWPTALAASTVTEYMAQSASRSQVVILDCCFSGAISGNLIFKGAADSIRDEIAQGRATLASSSGLQYSVVNKTGDLSLYTSYLIDGLEEGRADRNGDGAITADELHRYVKEKFQAEHPQITPKFYPWETGYSIVISAAQPKDAVARFRKRANHLAEMKLFSVEDIESLREEGVGLKLTPEVIEEVLGNLQVKKDRAWTWPRILAAALATLMVIALIAGSVRMLVIRNQRSTPRAQESNANQAVKLEGSGAEMLLPASYTPTPENTLPTDKMPLGVDVSHFNGAIDWNAMKTSGFRFAFVRAGQGRRPDVSFQANWNGAHKAGLLVGVYYFFVPSNDEIGDANWFLQQVSMRAGDLPPVVDVEDAPFVTGKPDDSAIAFALAQWMSIVESRTGRRPILCTSNHYTITHFRNLGALQSYPLWILQPGMSSPHPPAPWNVWTFWQYSDNVTLAGMSGRFDGNRFNGTYQDLRAFAGFPR
jgi:GH25 family lysozyme M1 (1,4-beta-N-acetylmuramidase)